MSEHKFKPGDIVIGNEKANDKYGFTVKGYVGKVLDVYDDDSFEIQYDGSSFKVLYECFDLYEPNKPSKKSKVISLVKENKALKAENEHLKEVNEAVINYLAAKFTKFLNEELENGNN